MLDLEGNSVEDLGQVRYLQLCPRLATLTLEGNLVCLRPGPSPSNKVRMLGTQAAHARDREALCGPPEVPGASLPSWALGMSRLGNGSIPRAHLRGTACLHPVPCLP